MELTVQDVVELSSDTILCEGDVELWRDLQISTSGVYYDTLRYASGCDSVRYTHHVTIHTAKDSLESLSICDGNSILWHGQDLSVSGIYYDTLRYTTTQCDSIRFAMTLTILTATDSIEQATICSGDTLSWHNQSLTTSGIYYDTLRYVDTECDSIRFQLELTLGNSYDTTEYVSICKGDIYVWHNHIISGQGVYIDTLSTILGCDSICRLVFTQPEPTYFEIDTLLCEGSSIYFANQWISDAGIYRDSLVTEKGCDSIVTLNVKFAHKFDGDIIVSDICADDSFIPVMLNYKGNTPTHYSVQFSQEALKEGFINESLKEFELIDSTIYIPVPHTEDRRDYPRPDIYSMKITVYDMYCGDSIASSDNFTISYPSWITDVRWNDAIILYNDQYNGGYKFSNIQWYYNGEPIDGETKDFLYQVHTLDTDGYYQARLTRIDDGKTFFTCPVYPQLTNDSNVISENYLCVVPTIVQKHNPVVDLQTNLTGKYYIFDLAGKLIEEENFEPCEHDAQTINLPPVGGMYILYFDVNEDERHFPHKVIVW